MWRAMAESTPWFAIPSRSPQGTEWLPGVQRYGSSLFEETERCTRCGGSGLVMVADEREQESNGGKPPQLGRAG